MAPTKDPRKTPELTFESKAGAAEIGTDGAAVISIKNSDCRKFEIQFRSAPKIETG